MLATLPDQDYISPGFPAWLSPQTRPDLTPLLALHRGEGCITLARIVADAVPPERPWQDWQRLGAILTRGPILPAVVETIERMMSSNGYASANTMRVPQRTQLAPLTGLIKAPRNQSAVSSLTSCWADLDFYRERPDLTPGVVVGMLIDDSRAGRIPRPSAFIFSGRGVWAQWFLANDDGGAVVNTPEHHRAWLAIQREILHRYAHLGADATALDSSKVCPFPGTVKDSGAQVEWFAALPPRAYTLRSLAAALGLPPVTPEAILPPSLPRLEIRRSMPTPPLRPIAERSTEHQRRYATRWSTTRDALLNLIDARRGGFEKGCRMRGAFYLTIALARCGEADLAARVLDYAARCRPPLPANEVLQKAIPQGLQPRAIAAQVSYWRMWADLRVTPEERRLLLGTWRAPRQHRTTGERRAAIKAIVRQLGSFPPARRMLVHLHAAGFLVKLTTVKTDYHELEHELGIRARRRGRPRNLPLEAR